jgi:hypothetical protein
MSRKRPTPAAVIRAMAAARVRESRAAGHRHRWHAHDAVGATGETAPLDGAVLDDEREGQGDHGEIGTRQPERGQG